MAFLASCGHSLGDDFGWPGEDGRTVCYPCFENQADASWWEMVAALEAHHFDICDEADCPYHSGDTKGTP